MKVPFTENLLPPQAVLLTCSSHEVRCRGLLSRLLEWHPKAAIIFHYDDKNPKREENHKVMESQLRKLSVNPVGLRFTESDAIRSLRDNMTKLHEILAANPDASILLDISVFTRRHLLMILRWLDDMGYWPRMTIVYSEPEDYDVSEFIPLSFGLKSLQHIPGFCASPDSSRPTHLVLFLGYEGDRALAVYEHVQPMQTTLVIPDPPYKPSWLGRTEQFNSDLLAVAGGELTQKVDPIDPDATYLALIRILGECDKRGHHTKVVCPLGTKPQTIGIYSYVRKCVDPPAILYASPLRHNHEFFSHGVGVTWILMGTT